MSESPGYDVRFINVAVAGGLDVKLRVLLDRQQYSDPSGQAEAAGISPAAWPMFGLLWPSAQKLADLMQVWQLGENRVLEVGCGLALASLVVHRREGNIAASDCHPLAESFLKANLLLNKLPALKYQVGNWGRINPASGTADLIIGSDLLYERDHPERLCGYISQQAAPTATVLIIDPNRSNRNAFHRHMAAIGFVLTESAINAPLADGTPYAGRLLRYQREREAPKGP